MAVLNNNFEGGTDGTTITTGNSGGVSGNAWDVVSGTATHTFDDDIALHGTFTGLWEAVGGSSGYLLWNTTSWTSAATTFMRIYFRTSLGIPAEQYAIAQFRNASGTAAGCELRVNTAGKLVLATGSTNRYTSSVIHGDGVLRNDTWYRVEVKIDASATVGHIQARVFYGANLEGVTEDEALGSATDNWNIYATGTGGMAVGVCDSAGASALNLSLDSIGMSTVDWIGSAAPSTPLTTPVVTVTNETDPSTIAGSDGSITVTWPAVFGAATYETAMADGLGQTTGFIVDSSAATSPYTFTGLTAGDYTVAVRANP